MAMPWEELKALVLKRANSVGYEVHDLDQLAADLERDTIEATRKRIDDMFDPNPGATVAILARDGSDLARRPPKS